MISINETPDNTCFVCSKPFIHRKRYWTCACTGLKEVEFIIAHPTCKSHDRTLNQYKNELYSYEVERKGHSREVRDLNKKIKNIKSMITDIEYQMFLKKYS